MPQNTYPGPQPAQTPGSAPAKRCRRALAIKLMSRTDWRGTDKVSSNIIITFLSHHAPRHGQDNGEVKIRIDGRDYIFAPPLASRSLGILIKHWLLPPR